MARNWAILAVVDERVRAVFACLRSKSLDEALAEAVAASDMLDVVFK